MSIYMILYLNRGYNRLGETGSNPRGVFFFLLIFPRLIGAYQNIGNYRGIVPVLSQIIKLTCHNLSRMIELA